MYALLVMCLGQTHVLYQTTRKQKDTCSMLTVSGTSLLWTETSGAILGHSSSLRNTACILTSPLGLLRALLSTSVPDVPSAPWSSLASFSVTLCWDCYSYHNCQSSQCFIEFVSQDLAFWNLKSHRILEIVLVVTSSHTIYVLALRNFA